MHTTTQTAKLHTDFYNHISRTPIVRTNLGNELVSFDLKDETMQESGSFKDRGALNAVLSLYQEDPELLHRYGVVAASAGNHGQGVARAARVVGIRATVFVPESTPLTKLRAMENYGATVIKIPGDVDKALQAAFKYQQEELAQFIHPFDDPAVMSGQGSVGAEIIEEAGSNGYHRVYVPVGGGGLVTGIAAALHEHGSNAEVTGVQLVGSDSFARSLVQGEQVMLTSANPLSDGTAVRQAGALTLKTALELPNLNRIITVTEAELGGAMQLHERELGIIAEPAGALALAGMLHDLINSQTVRSEKWVGIVSGNHRDEKRYSMLQNAAERSCGKVV